MTPLLRDWSRVRLWHGAGERIEFDVGCSSGQFLIERARHAPDTRVIGIDINRHVIPVVEAKIAAEGLDNAFVRRGDAAELLTDPRGVPDGAATIVHVYFPTPEENARRDQPLLLRPALFEALARTVHRGGLLRFATDRREVFDRALASSETVREHWRPVAWHRLDIGLGGAQMVGSGAEQTYLTQPGSKLHLMQLRRR